MLNMQMFFSEHGQNLQNSYLKKLFPRYAKQKPMVYSTSGVLEHFDAGVNKITYILRWTWKSYLKVCLSMYNLSLPIVVKGLENVLEIFKE